MELHTLVTYRRPVDQLVRGVLGREAEVAINQLLEGEQWELLGMIILAAAETSARQLATVLLERRAWEPLTVAACLRRQPPRRTTAPSRTAVGRRVFRDFDQEAATAAVPEHIRAEAEEMQQLAVQSLGTAERRDELIDRDPIREFIVTELAKLLTGEPEALNALVTIARAAAWENTRRTAALKVANHAPSIKRLAAERRAEDLVAVSESAGLTAVAETIAKALGTQWAEDRDHPDAAALEFIAAKHPESQWRASAQETIEYLRRPEK